MNPTAQRYLPPLIVIGSAFYFGWPPSKPLDLGDDIVRATSVRWKSDDLTEPTEMNITADPFREVFVAEKNSEAPEPDQVEVPVGPDPAILRAGLLLDGFANTAGRRWAIINGRPRVVGDMVSTLGAESHLCEILTVDEERVVVRCEETLTELHPQPFGTRAAPNASSASPAIESESPQEAAPSLQQIPPPPQA